MLTTNFITFLAFVFIAGLVYMVARRLALGQRNPVDQRLAAALPERLTSSNDRGRVTQALASSLSRQIPQFQKDTEQLDRELRRAGYYHPRAREDFLALRNVLVIVVVIMTCVLAAFAGPTKSNVVMWYIIGGMVTAALCWAMPRIILKIRAARRVAKIRRALPDALDMVSMCLTGGLSLTDALAHVSREVYFAYRDLATELLIVRRQADMTSFEFAFRQLANRIDLPEIQSLSAIITQNQRLGTDVVESVRDFADSLRLKWRQLNDERAAKASVKILFPLILFLLPSIFILLWGPAIVDLVNFWQTYKSTYTNQAI